MKGILSELKAKENADNSTGVPPITAS